MSVERENLNDISRKNFIKAMGEHADVVFMDFLADVRKKAEKAGFTVFSETMEGVDPINREFVPCDSVVCASFAANAENAEKAERVFGKKAGSFVREQCESAENKEPHYAMCQVTVAYGLDERNGSPVLLACAENALATFSPKAERKGVARKAKRKAHVGIHSGRLPHL